MKKFLAIALVIMPTLAAGQDSTADKTFGTVRLYMGIAGLLAADERCEKLPPILKQVITEIVQRQTAENQRIIEALRRSLMKATWSAAEREEVCQHERARAREWMGDIDRYIQSR